MGDCSSLSSLRGHRDILSVWLSSPTLSARTIRRTTGNVNEELAFDVHQPTSTNQRPTLPGSHRSLSHPHVTRGRVFRSHRHGLVAMAEESDVRWTRTTIFTDLGFRALLQSTQSLAPAQRDLFQAGGNTAKASSAKGRLQNPTALAAGSDLKPVLEGASFIGGVEAAIFTTGADSQLLPKDWHERC